MGSFNMPARSAGSGGEILSRLKYNAVNGIWTFSQRVQQGADWVTNDYPVPAPFNMWIDLKSAEVGWSCIKPQTAPDYHLAPVGHPFPDQPSKDHKMCMRVVCVNKNGERMHFNTQAGSIIETFEAIYDAWKTMPESQQGALANVQFGASTPVQTKGGGTNNVLMIPTWTIVGLNHRNEFPAVVEADAEAASLAAQGNQGQSETPNFPEHPQNPMGGAPAQQGGTPPASATPGNVATTGAPGVPAQTGPVNTGAPAPQGQGAIGANQPMMNPAPGAPAQTGGAPAQQGGGAGVGDDSIPFGPFKAC